MDQAQLEVMIGQVVDDRMREKNRRGGRGKRWRAWHIVLVVNALVLGFVHSISVDDLRAVPMPLVWGGVLSQRGTDHLTDEHAFLDAGQRRLEGCPADLREPDRRWIRCPPNSAPNGVGSEIVAP